MTNDEKDVDFEAVEFGAVANYPKQYSAFRKNDYVMIKGRPCKVTNAEKREGGTIEIHAVDMFNPDNDEKLRIYGPPKITVHVPVVKRKEFQVLSINDGIVSLKDPKTGNTKDGLRLPDGNIGDELKVAFEKDKDGLLLVNVVAACGKKAISGWKEKEHLVDIGANLAHQKLAKDVEAIIEKARGAGLMRIMVTGACKDSVEGASKLVDKYPEILRYTAGVHPHNAQDYMQEESLAFIIPHLSQQKCVAIGECGLDFSKTNYVDWCVQETVFERQLMMACDRPEPKKPLFVHETDASEKMVEMLEKYLPRLPFTVIHCFMGTAGEAKKYIDMGLYIGVTGYLLLPHADKEGGLRQALRDGIIPLDKLLLETDAPYMYPRVPKETRVKYSEKALTNHKLASFDVNHPCSLLVICEAVALLMGIDESEVAKQTTINAFRVYGLDQIHETMED